MLIHVKVFGYVLHLPQWTLTIVIFLIFLILSQMSCCKAPAAVLRLFFNWQKVSFLLSFGLVRCALNRYIRETVA